MKYLRHRSAASELASYIAPGDRPAEPHTASTAAAAFVLIQYVTFLASRRKKIAQCQRLALCSPSLPRFSLSLARARLSARCSWPLFQSNAFFFLYREAAAAGHYSRLQNDDPRVCLLARGLPKRKRCRVGIWSGLRNKSWI